jgi:antitoxin component YwqK of YwqJK toxin-antitoxin module
VWNPDAGKWEVSRKDAQGTREGECLLYRDDGTLYSRTRFVAGLQDGPFFVYHPDGAVAREGDTSPGASTGR